MSFTDLAKTALGTVEKAKLIVHKDNTVDPLDPENVAGKTGKILNGTASSDGSGRFSSIEIEVQYNPASLTFQANAEPIPFTYLQQNVDNGVPHQNMRPPMVMLSVELIFDAVNAQDAFMMDRLRLSADTMVSNVRAVSKLADGGYTVQPQTNGLLATLLRPDTKYVTFFWSDMSFTGEVVEAEAQYTMFSPYGKPIRSQVRMNISQKISSKGEDEYWDSAADKVFKKGTFNGKGLGQKVGNVLNLDAF